MRNRIKNIRLIGLIIVISIMVFIVIMPIRLIQSTNAVNTIALSTLLSFVLYFFTTSVLCKKYQSTIRASIVLILMILGLLFLQLPLRIMSFSDTLITLPELLISLLGIFFGYLSYLKSKTKNYLFASGIVLCILMWIWGYSWFFHLIK